MSSDKKYYNSEHLCQSNTYPLFFTDTAAKKARAFFPLNFY
jgi:hypothetical protein